MRVDAGRDRDASLRTLTFDQYEFAAAHTEERLTVTICRAAEFRNTSGLLGFARCSLDLPKLGELPVPVDLARFADVIAHLERFTDLFTGASSRWLAYAILDDWPRRRMVIDAGERYVGYDWFSSA